MVSSVSVTPGVNSFKSTRNQQEALIAPGVLIQTGWQENSRIHDDDDNDDDDDGDDDDGDDDDGGGGGGGGDGDDEHEYKQEKE